MIESKFITKLKTVGLEIQQDFIELKGKKSSRREKISEIKTIKLVKTDEEDYSNFWSHFFKSFNRMGGNHSSAIPSRIYRLYIIKTDEEEFYTKIQDFDLIGVTRAIEKLNQKLSTKAKQ